MNTSNPKMCKPKILKVVKSEELYIKKEHKHNSQINREAILPQGVSLKISNLINTKIERGML